MVSGFPPLMVSPVEPCELCGEYSFTIKTRKSHGATCEDRSHLRQQALSLTFLNHPQNSHSYEPTTARMPHTNIELFVVPPFLSGQSRDFTPAVFFLSSSSHARMARRLPVAIATLVSAAP